MIYFVFEVDFVGFVEVCEMNVVNFFFGKVVGVNVFIIFIGVVGFLWVVICGNNLFFGIN